MSNVEKVKCTCADCVCSVSPDKAVMRGDQAFCCEACADGHKSHAGCDHDGCACHG